MVFYQIVLKAKKQKLFLSFLKINHISIKISSKKDNTATVSYLSHHSYPVFPLGSKQLIEDKQVPRKASAWFSDDFYQKLGSHKTKQNCNPLHTSQARGLVSLPLPLTTEGKSPCQRTPARRLIAPIPRDSHDTDQMLQSVLILGMYVSKVM